MVVLLLAVIVFSGALLRLDNLDDKTLTHPEVFAPGINLPEGISRPPSRLTLRSVLSFHFHIEPHPPGYYFLMWVWTKLLGTSLYALRLPSVLFGIGSIILIFWITSLVYDRTVALLSAAFLAFNGHHIYWTQQARNYPMMCFLGLLSTLLWLQLLRGCDRRPLREALYVVVSVLGVFTEILFWPFLVSQILWTIVHRWTSSKVPPRIVTLQALIIILGSPAWAHAIYRARSSHLEPLSLAFLREFISFGFLFERDYFSDPYRDLPTLGAVLLLLLAVVCIGRSLSDPGRKLTSPPSSDGLGLRQLLPVAIAAVLTIFALAAIARSRQLIIALASIIPVTAVFMPFALNRVWALIKPKLEKVEKHLAGVPGWRSPIFFLAFLPALAVVGMSFKNSMIGGRLFLLFTPYVLIVIAVGARNLLRRPFIGIALAGVLVAVHFLSISYYRSYPSEVYGYQELAQKVEDKIKKDDLIFVHKRSWATTPIFYYLNYDRYQFVAENFQDAVNRYPGSRVWLIEFIGEPPTKEMHSALAGFQLQDQVMSLRSIGSLYTKDGPSSSALLLQSASLKEE